MPTFMSPVLWPVLSIIGTAVAASPDDARVAAATDGRRIFVTTDAGGRWRPLGGAAAPGEGDGLGADEAPAPEETPVRAVAITRDEVLAATTDGLLAWPVGGGPATRRSARRLVALAWDGRRLWATDEQALLVSDDGGRRFARAARLPGAVTTLGAADGVVIAAGPDGAWVREGEEWWRRIAGGALAVAAGADGGLWRLVPGAVERSRDGGHSFRPVAALSARAIAVGAGDAWLASGRRVARLGELVDAPRPPRPALEGFPLAEILDRAARARLWPRVELVATAVRAGGEIADASWRARGEVVVWLQLTWELDAPVPVAEAAGTAVAVRRAWEGTPWSAE